MVEEGVCGDIVEARRGGCCLWRIMFISSVKALLELGMHIYIVCAKGVSQA